MLFGYVTLFVAFILSAVAAYYSVLGLVAIFSAAAIPVIVMGGALETGKVIAAMWLHRNWQRAPWTYKAYLLPSLLALMLLTSMGTFGYLSKAHSDQSLVSGDVTSKMAIYDEKIRISRENIDASRAALKQLDAAVDQIMGRSTTEQGAERSVQIRRQQAPERQRLIREIEAEQKKISELNEARAPIAAEVRKVEAEVGPIKYIAALLYGDNPENNLLESAVRWVIVLIVTVFDPLAIVLILAGTRHLEWERAARVSKPTAPDNTDIVAVDEPTTTSTSTTSTTTTSSSTTTTTTTTTEPPPIEQVYLARPGTWFKWAPLPSETSTTTTEPVEYNIINDQYIEINGKTMSQSALANSEYSHLLPEIKRRSNELFDTQPPATFGVNYPANPMKGHLHVHTGVLPSKLYKYNGTTWIEVDKSISDSYTSNEQYIKFLIGQLDQNIITVDDLTVAEQEMVSEYLKNNPNA
jgi:cytochrome c oxidase subunit IV